MISRRSDEAEAPARVAEARGAGRKPSTHRHGAELGTATSGRTKSEDHALMERVVERSNVWLAYQRVVENKGAPGVDGVTVAEFKDWLKVHWPSVKRALLEGSYLPRPVRRVDIPKPSASASVRGAARSTPCAGRKRTSAKASAGWWILIWRGSSIGLIT
jgi:RNA-directed DNA polymerase